MLNIEQWLGSARSGMTRKFRSTTVSDTSHKAFRNAHDIRGRMSRRRGKSGLAQTPQTSAFDPMRH